MIGYFLWALFYVVGVCAVLILAAVGLSILEDTPNEWPRAYAFVAVAVVLVALLLAVGTWQARDRHYRCDVIHKNGDEAWTECHR